MQYLLGIGYSHIVTIGLKVSYFSGIIFLPASPISTLWVFPYYRYC
jgi:hypothetical protein